MSRTRLPILTAIVGALAFLIVFTPGCSKDSDSSTGATGGVITVTGKVVSATLRPVPNTPVVIAGLPATTTDANGAFSIPGVTPPYDITVVISASKLGIIYRGLTRPDPTLVNLLSAVAAPNSATISGTVSGGAGYPQPANRTSGVVFVATEATGGAAPNNTTGAYTMPLGWEGATTITGVLHALQWETNAAGMPQAFNGYTSKSGVTVSSGGTFAGQNLAMTTVTGATVSGTITVPATVTLAQKFLRLQFSSDRSLQLGSETGSATAFTYNVPTVTGTTISIAATGMGGGGSSSTIKAGITPGATNVALALIEVPQLSLPVNAATNVTTTTPFSWTAAASVVSVLIFNGPAGQPDYLIFTGAASTTIPDLNSLGLGLPAGVSYTWNVTLIGPHASLDAAAGSNGFMPLGDQLSAGSSSRTFTTAP